MDDLSNFECGKFDEDFFLLFAKKKTENALCIDSFDVQWIFRSDSILTSSAYDKLPVRLNKTLAVKRNIQFIYRTLTKLKRCTFL